MMNQWLETIKGWWAHMGFTQKMVAGTVVFAMILAAVFFTQRAKNDYDILYSNLDVSDAAMAVAKLKEMKTPYRLSDGGTTILVPRHLKNEITLETAGALNSEQTVNLAKIPPVVQGAVEKEWLRKVNTDAISNVLRSISGVRNAQVIVSQPEPSVFADDDQPPTASVMLMVDPGFRLTDEQVKTIRNLVAHAVPGLRTDNVVISDNLGRSLDGVSQVNGAGAADARRRRFEEEVTKKVKEVLTPIVGQENVVVAVTAKLNFDQTQSRIHRVVPAGGSGDEPTGLAISKQEAIEAYNGSGPRREGGPVGVSANTDITAPAYGSSGDNESGGNNMYKSEKRTINFAHSEEDKSIVHAQGEVERMTVAVVLNKVLTSAETDQIREFVANAAGLDFERGDSIDIKGFQFSESPMAREKELMAQTKAAQEQGFIIQVASIAGVLLVALVGLVTFFMLLRKPAEGELLAGEQYLEGDEEMAVLLSRGRRRGPNGEIYDADDDDYPALTGGGMSLVDENGVPIAADTPDFEGSLMQVPVHDPRIEQEIEQMRDSINQMVENDPAQVAQVLTTYMREGRNL